MASLRKSTPPVIIDAVLRGNTSQLSKLLLCTDVNGNLDLIRRSGDFCSFYFPERDSSGRSALHAAAALGKSDIIGLLLRASASVRVRAKIRNHILTSANFSRIERSH
jgi:ankyrin repeat protein